MAIYVTSDHHFGHKQIIEYCNRPFDSVDEMNNVMIRRWNDTVKKNDVVYHLGDFALGSKKFKEDTLHKLNGKKILVRGNHDKTIAHCLSIGFDEVHDTIIVGNCLMKHVGFKYIPSINVSVENWGYRPIPLPTPKNFLQLCGHSHNNYIVRSFKTDE